MVPLVPPLAALVLEALAVVLPVLEALAVLAVVLPVLEALAVLPVLVVFFAAAIMTSAAFSDICGAGAQLIGAIHVLEVRTM